MPRLDRGIQFEAPDPLPLDPAVEPRGDGCGAVELRGDGSGAVEPRGDGSGAVEPRGSGSGFSAGFAVCWRYLLILLLLLAALPIRAAELGVLTQNLNRLYDDIDDGYDEPVASPARYAARIRLAADRIGGQFGLPQIIALQEVENLGVLERLAEEIGERYATGYRAILLPGQDPSGIDIGFLLHSDLQVRAHGQLFRDLKLPYDGSPLFSRPPLYVETCYRGKCLTLLNLHLRSMRGIGGAQGNRIRQKRLLQAETIAAWCDRQQRERPDLRLILLGDLNALTPPDTHVDVAGIIRGAPDNSRVRLRGRDLLDPDLVDLSATVAPARRFSYRFRGRDQQLDYLFVNQAFDAPLAHIEFSPIEREFSDHAGLLAAFDW